MATQLDTDLLYKIKIGDITDIEGGFATVVPAPGQDIEDNITVTENYVNEFSPVVGGYILMYPKGVCGYSSE